MLKGYDVGEVHTELGYLVSESECKMQQNKCLHGIFNNEHLNANYRKLDQYY